MKRQTDADIIELSLNLLSPEDREELKSDATVLLATMHEWNYNQGPRRKVMFGEKMAYELLYSLGRFLNEEYPLDGAD